ncbi:hypothetical protein BX666DRAFT_1868276 [Dichotomocladium elegans]|nr:hypothetical protein BX666DRAFT_1868276 [Dichotomocladium elegans]
MKPICSNCNATSTPLWRRSTNDELLCNACGLYQKLHNAPRPKTLKPNNGRKDVDEATQLVCSNCSTTTTPLWRRDEGGSPLCNACGLYLKLHHERRPLSMKTDIIKKRQRYESANNANASPGKKPVKRLKMDQSRPSSPTLPPNEPATMVQQQLRRRQQQHHHQDHQHQHQQQPQNRPVFLNHGQFSVGNAIQGLQTQQHQHHHQQQQQQPAFVYVNQQRQDPGSRFF